MAIVPQKTKAMAENKHEDHDHIQVSVGITGAKGTAHSDMAMAETRMPSSWLGILRSINGWCD